MPATRSPAQIEASRRNGARSKGPVTQEGKARASRNALKHGLTAMEHLVLEDEVPDDLEELIETVAEETGATTEIEHCLARRLAIAFWKSERADKIETALFDAAPKIRPPHGGFQWEEADPLTTFDVKRFNAIRVYHAQQGREIGRCLKELRLLRKEALAGAGEPEVMMENEPNDPHAPANDDAVSDRIHCPDPIETPSENKPDPWDALPNPLRAELERLLASDDWPGLAELGAIGALRLEPADLASPEALGRALFRRAA